MSDFETLTDAFAELERRADLTTPRDDLALQPARPIGHKRATTRPVLVGASVLAAAAVAIGVVVLTGGSNPAAHRNQAGNAPSSTPTTISSPPAFTVPSTATDLEARFQRVLDDVVPGTTFTVTDTGHAVNVTTPRHALTTSPNGTTGDSVGPVYADGEPNGAAIVGVLTSGGVSGGYDMQIYQGKPGDTAWCDEQSSCRDKEVIAGSSVAVSTTQLQNNAQGVTYQVTVVRPDGVTFLMHVSNEANPKGESTVLAPNPPLTKDQMTALLTSTLW